MPRHISSEGRFEGVHVNGLPVKLYWNHKTFVEPRFGNDVGVDKRSVHVAVVVTSIWMYECDLL